MTINDAELFLIILCSLRHFILHNIDKHSSLQLRIDDTVFYQYYLTAFILHNNIFQCSATQDQRCSK